MVWKGQSRRHSKAAQKGWWRKKRKIKGREVFVTRNGRRFPVPDKGKPGRTPPKDRFFKTKDEIEDYKITDSERRRRRAIDKKIRRMGGFNRENSLEVFQKLHGLSNVTKRSNPVVSRTARKDADYVDKKRERRFGTA